MRRFDDWPVRLDAAVEAARLRPHRWGQHDCALWAASVVHELTGVDPAAHLRGTYTSKIGALRVMADHGDLITLGGNALGASVPIAMAGRGDVCLGRFDENHGGVCLGICIGDRVAFTGLDGLVFVPLLDCELAWHV